MGKHIKIMGDSWEIISKSYKKVMGIMGICCIISVETLYFSWKIAQFSPGNSWNLLEF